MRVRVALSMPLLLLYAASLSAAESIAENAVAEIRQVSVAANERGVTIRIDLSQPRSYVRNEITSPARLYLDFPATRLGPDVVRSAEVGHRLVQRVRAGQFSDEPPVARVVLDLPGRAPVEVLDQDGGKTLFLKLGQGPDLPAPTPLPEPTVAVTGASWSRQETTEAVLQVDLSQAAKVDAFYLDSPDRVVVDIQAAELKTEVPAPGRENGVVGAVRTSQYGVAIARLVLDLKVPAGFRVAARTGPARIEITVTRGATAGRVIVIDPGHGGKDPGTRGYRPGLAEKDIVLAVARRVADLLARKGLPVVLTRENDSYVALYDRPALANRIGGALFVSIHCNAVPPEKKGTIYGAELYFHNPNSLRFAQVMHDAYTEATGLTSRGVRQRRFVVVRETTMPSVLVELGYLDHPLEGAKLEDPVFQQRCAEGIVNGVMRFAQWRRSGTPAVAAREPLGPAAPDPGDEEG